MGKILGFKFFPFLNFFIQFKNPRICSLKKILQIKYKNRSSKLTSKEVEGEGVAAPGVQGEGGPHFPLDSTKNFHSGPSLIT